MADEKETLSAEVQAKLKELDDLKGKFSSVEFVVDGKPQRLNLTSDAEFEKAKQFLAGGAKFSQNQAALKAEREAFEKQKAEATRKAAEGAAGAGASEQDVANLEQRIAAELENDPEFQSGVTDGDPKAQAKATARAIAKATASLKPAPVQPVDVGATVRTELNRERAFSRAASDPTFTALAKALGRGDVKVGAKMIAESYNGTEGAVAPESDAGEGLLKFAQGWAGEMGVKPVAAEAPPAAAEPGKETPPAGSQPGGSGAPGPEVPKFKNQVELRAWKAEQEKKKTGFHSYREA